MPAHNPTRTGQLRATEQAHGRYPGAVAPDAYTEPDLGSAALVTIDAQRDTLDGQPLEIPGTSEALTGMARLAQAFRDTSSPIVHIVRIYQPDGANVDLCRRAAIEGGLAALGPGADGTQIAAPLLPDPSVRLDDELLLAGGIQRLGPHETVIYKPRWGAFYATPLESHLRRANVTSLVFCGANFPNCPRTSIYEASERDFRIALVREASSGLYDRGESELERIGVRLWTVDDVVSRLSARVPTGA
jgi:nicotinamidase-related amidase